MGYPSCQESSTVFLLQLAIQYRLFYILYYLLSKPDLFWVALLAKIGRPISLLPYMPDSCSKRLPLEGYRSNPPTNLLDLLYLSQEGTISA